MAVTFSERATGAVTIIEINGGIATSDGAHQHLHDKVRSLLHHVVITKLATVFEMFDDEAKAVASFGG